MTAEGEGSTAGLDAVAVARKPRLRATPPWNVYAVGRPRSIRRPAGQVLPHHAPAAALRVKE
ncbi:hypothetical protein ACGRHY_00280 [Streptomyces sp. HK10]|uniref:hypothetical protein n=1 Tax=Streptomyces sp. HK10 TaxID=3373255 RepID=UPI00374964C7